MHAFRIAVVALALAGAGNTYAQGQIDVSGQWRCQWAGQAHNNDPTQSHLWEFNLAINQNRQFQGQGSYYSPSIGYTETFQGYGNWQLQNSAQGLVIGLNGTWVRSLTGSQQYPVYMYVRDARTMLYNNVDQYTRTHYLCQR